MTALPHTTIIFDKHGNLLSVGDRVRVGGCGESRIVGYDLGYGGSLRVAHSWLHGHHPDEPNPSEQTVRVGHIYLRCPNLELTEVAEADQITGAGIVNEDPCIAGAARQLWDAATEHWLDTGYEGEEPIPLAKALYDNPTAYDGMPIRGQDLYWIGVALGFIEEEESDA